jgi:hypothetical protein
MPAPAAEPGFISSLPGVFCSFPKIAGRILSSQAITPTPGETRNLRDTTLIQENWFMPRNSDSRSIVDLKSF